jgi:uncharacterized protein YecE (DUF72 family)
MAIRIGCGSWADPDYAELLYPRGASPDMRLSGYAMWFDRVEVNSSYYSTPKKETVMKWISNTPPEFLFDIRVHRIISQGPAKAAKEGRLLPYFLESMEPLIKAKQLGTFLLVLSPGFGPERHQLEELDGLIEKMRPHPLAIELRHAAWVDGKNRAATLAFFRTRKVTWVSVDMPPIKGSELMPAVDEVTDLRMAYLRLHGRNLKYMEAESAAERHAYAYTESDLQGIVKRIRNLAARAKDVHVSANNHAFDLAPRAALALKEMLGQL